MRRKKVVQYKKNGNLTISECNEAGALLPAKVSGALWVAAVGICEIGKGGGEEESFEA